MLSATDKSEAAYADAYPLPTLTGDYCNDLISVARSQEGYAASADNDSVYWNWAGAVGTSKNWCSEFVAWCAKSANIPDDIIPIKWSSGGYRDFYSEKEVFYTINGGCVDKECSCSTKTTTSISPYDIKCGDLLLTETNDNLIIPTYQVLYLKHEDMYEIRKC